MHRVAWISLVCVAVSFGLCACKERKPEGSAATLRIAVIPKGTTHDFWKSVHAGAIKAQRELEGVRIIWQGPAKEDDRDQQITVVQNFISSRVDGIVLAPLDDRALLSPVRTAGRAGIPVVIIDSGLLGQVGKDYISFVATDNVKGGQLAARRLGELLGGKGTALLLRYQEGSDSTTKREQGFVQTLHAEFPDIRLIDEKQYAGATRDSAQKVAENLLTSHPNIDGVFCPNESSTFGMLLALRSKQMAGKVKFVGFDSSEGLIEAMRQGHIHGLVLQNPLRMGYEGVKTIVAHIRGQKVEARIDTGVVLATPENMDEPEIKQLLSPDLSAYLGS